MDTLIDSTVGIMQHDGDLDQHLQDMTQSNEIMMQRDPEIMKQKQPYSAPPEQLSSKPGRSAGEIDD